RFHLGLFIFNPYGVVGWLEFVPRFHLGLFIFNPYGVVGWLELIGGKGLPLQSCLLTITIGIIV
ncbi:MAG: hypothetical protein DRR08_20015, partial [Candidatus Parabeggiatoa sp. nov. 2]